MPPTNKKAAAIISMVFIRLMSFAVIWYTAFPSAKDSNRWKSSKISTTREHRAGPQDAICGLKRVIFLIRDYAENLIKGIGSNIRTWLIATVIETIPLMRFADGCPSFNFHAFDKFVYTFFLTPEVFVSKIFRFGHHKPPIFYLKQFNWQLFLIPKRFVLMNWFGDV